MESVLERDELDLGVVGEGISSGVGLEFPPLSCEFDRSFVRFGAGIAEKDLEPTLLVCTNELLVVVLRLLDVTHSAHLLRRFDEQDRQLARPLVVPEIRVVHEYPRLVRHDVRNPLIGVPERVHGDSTRKVEIDPIRAVRDGAALARAHDEGRTGVGGEGDFGVARESIEGRLGRRTVQVRWLEILRGEGALPARSRRPHELRQHFTKPRANYRNLTGLPLLLSLALAPFKSRGGHRGMNLELLSESVQRQSPSAR